MTTHARCRVRRPLAPVGVGPGFVELDRVQYNALKQIAANGGDISKCQKMFDNDPKFKNNPEKIQEALALYRTYCS